MNGSDGNIHKKELSLISRLNWDYNISAEELLAIIKKKGDASNMRLCFFIKSLVGLSWDDLLFLWGAEECDKLYTDKVRKGIFPKTMLERCDALFSHMREQKKRRMP